jgi:thiol-disulfide isomerase/thioredoxin
MKCLLLGLILCLVPAIIVNAQSSSLRLEGQVVCCAACWGEADRTKVEYGTTENLLKAESCVEGGDPTLLALREGDKFKLYQLALGRFRLPGKNWLDFVGKRVAVNGTIQTRKDTSIIRVDSLEVLAPSPAERDAAKLVGQEVGLTLKDLSGSDQNVAALKGRIVILNFWATYCIPCRTEMPELIAIQNEYAAFDVQVVGASTDTVEDRDKVLQFVKEVKINFPIWTGASTSDMIRFGLGAALPGTVVIGKDGRVAKVISGVINQAVLKKQLDAMLNATASADTSRNERDDIAKTSKRPAEVSSVPS